MEDYPIEQYVRDSKIDTLHEGTTAIQYLDLFFRKIMKNKGQALGAVTAEIGDFLSDETGNGRLKIERELLARGLEDAQAVVGLMIGHLVASNPQQGDGDVNNVYKVGLNTTRLLMVLGDVVCAYLLLRQADVALTALSGDVTAKDERFYAGKVAAAQFFARQVLPKVTAERAIAEATDLLAMDVAEDSL